MSKITFRAADELVARLEEYDASKSEVMRDALRAYLDERSADAGSADERTLDDLVRQRVDEVVAERVDALDGRTGEYFASRPQDINVNISLDGEKHPSVDDEPATTTTERKTRSDADPDPSDAVAEERKRCGQCGEDLSPSAVYCSNCGEKATHRVFCDCGDELRSDWSFCPGCGRRTPAADVLDGP
jgi:Arc/MetJ-type ribon-helix-helix transcriptional regulator